MDEGFALPEWRRNSFKSGFLMFIISLVAAGYCANWAGIMFYHSQDDILLLKKSEDDEKDNKP